MDKVFMLSKDAMELFPVLTKSARKVILLLAKEADKNGLVHFSRLEVASKADVSPRGAQQAMDQLKQNDLIKQAGYKRIAVNASMVSVVEREPSFAASQRRVFEDQGKRHEYFATRAGVVGRKNLGMEGEFLEKNNAERAMAKQLVQTGTRLKSEVDVAIKAAGVENDK